MLSWIISLVFVGLCMGTARTSKQYEITSLGRTKESKGNAWASLLFGILAICTARYF